MNILPKKRWHVRTKDNIARVRKDEAKAAEEEKQRQLRVKKAETEAKLELLRKKARTQYVHSQESSITSQESDHINLFYELKNDTVINKPNLEYEKEKKLETEKYEKQIGYLTYLGQDTNELTGNVSWYNKDPEERKSVVEEVAKEAKILEDPLTDMRKYLGVKNVEKVKQNQVSVKEELDQPEITNKSEMDYIFLTGVKKVKKKKEKSKKRKKEKGKRKRKYSSDSDSSDTSEIEAKKKANLEKLRAERMKREKEERKRAEAHLQSLKGEVNKRVEVEEVKPKYNFQFNPHLARQNIIRR